MKDVELKKLILDELASEVDIKLDSLGIAVEQGVVTLLGTQPTLAAISSVENAVKRTGGVKAVVTKIDIEPIQDSPSDKEIAKTIVRLFELQENIHEKQLQIIVESGIVTLSGVVEHQHERLLIRSFVEMMKGVVKVIDKIQVSKHVTDNTIRTSLLSALKRRSGIDETQLSVAVARGVVYLNGTVRNLIEKESVEETTWSVPGVKFIIDRLVVRQASEHAETA